MSGVKGDGLKAEHDVSCHFIKCLGVQSQCMSHVTITIEDNFLNWMTTRIRHLTVK